MIKKIIGIVVLLGGVVGLLLSATADVVGVWNVTQDNPDVMAFGWVQISGVVAGIVIALLGVVFLVVLARKPAEEETPPETLTQAPAQDAGTVAPAESVAQQQDLYAQQDLYGTQPAAQDTQAAQSDIPVRRPTSAQQQQEPAQTMTDEPAMDFGIGTEEPQADEGEMLDELDGLEGLEDLAEELGGDSDEVYECPDCGADLPANATECPTCGASFSEEIFECPVCGSEVPEDASECPKCGEEFAEED
jgi:ribosomal protein L40E